MNSPLADETAVVLPKTARPESSPSIDLRANPVIDEMVQGLNQRVSAIIAAGKEPQLFIGAKPPAHLAESAVALRVKTGIEAMAQLTLAEQQAMETESPLAAVYRKLKDQVRRKVDPYQPDGLTPRIIAERIRDRDYDIRNNEDFAILDELELLVLEEAEIGGMPPERERELFRRIAEARRASPAEHRASTEWAPAVLQLGERNRQLEEASKTDLLTGLLNREGFRAEVDRQKAEGTSGVLLYWDLNGFKAINDDPAIGYQMADRALQSIGQMMLRKGVLTGRMGGDEFCSFFPDTDDIKGSAYSIARKFLVAMTELEVQIRAEEGVSPKLRRLLHASFGGVTTGGQTLEQAREAEKRASTLMKTAKKPAEKATKRFPLTTQDAPEDVVTAGRHELTGFRKAFVGLRARLFGNR